MIILFVICPMSRTWEKSLKIQFWNAEMLQDRPNVALHLTRKWEMLADITIWVVSMQKCMMATPTIRLAIISHTFEFSDMFKSLSQLEEQQCLVDLW